MGVWVGVEVGVGVWVGVGVSVDVGVGVKVGVDVAVAVVRNGGGVRSEGALQANAPTINMNVAQRAVFCRRISVLSPGEGVCQSWGGMSFRPTLFHPRLAQRADQALLAGC